MLGLSKALVISAVVGSLADYGVRKNALLDATKNKALNNATPTGNLTELAGGFIWAENIWVDGRGGLYIAEDSRGEVYKLTRPSYSGPITNQLWLSGFSHVLGIQNVWGSDDMMYAVVEFKTTCVAANSHLSNSTLNGIIVFNTSTPGAYSTFVCTDGIGNGLSVNNKNGLGTIYSPSEGQFLPKQGHVFEIDPSTRAVTTPVTGLYSADGAFLDQATQLLYVSEVILGHILIYNVSHPGTYPLVSSYHALGCVFVDDFCVLNVSPSGAPSPAPYLFAADYWAGSVVAFPADGTGEPVVLATGLQAPTSVRGGFGPGWDNPHSVYVSEGGGIFPSDNTRRVWELHLS